MLARLVPSSHGSIYRVLLEREESETYLYMSLRLLNCAVHKKISLFLYRLLKIQLKSYESVYPLHCQAIHSAVASSPFISGRAFCCRTRYI